ncbi:hypothetical protein TSAR_015669 [Trichomalopsis sarcophagae]|uniref:Sodium-coupled monocarboxylate transporter 1 n=1 Tax=Trichomalopsis sarcophagae TaxID=543379 RepID=A0A232F298_9HYME|nr:hypothetical protein TSAR_015669 [Trichomalopsis sarcophagae]
MENAARKQFDLVDGLVFAGMLGVSAVVGVYQAYKSRKNPNAVKEYLVGGQKMSIFPISMSLIASYISGIAILGLPAEMYVYGTQLWCIVIADCFVSLTMAIVYLPVFYGLQITSSYEYLELRFNHVVRLIGSFIFLMKMLLYIPLVIYVPALAFNQVTGVNLHMIASIVCAVCIFYTTLVSLSCMPKRIRCLAGKCTQGGLKAVVWTDAIQTIVMFGGVIVVAVLGTARAGGWSEVWRRNLETGRVEFFNMDPNPTVRHTFWTVVVGNYLNWLATCSVNQAMVQRCLAMPNLRKSNITIAIMAVGIVAIVSLSCYTGIVIFAAFHDCDPVSTKQIRKPDQLLPFFVMEMARTIPGLPGLFVSGVFSAALSTMSTGLNSMSGVIYEDMIKPCLKKPMSDVAASRVMKLTVVVIGVVCVALVLLVEKLSGLIQAGKSLSGITAGPLLGIFTLGMFFPFANSMGAIAGALVSLNLVAWISFGTQAAVATGKIHFPVKPVSVDGCPDALKFSAANLSLVIESAAEETPFFLYRMSYLWYTWVGFLTAIIVGLLVSWITGPNKYKAADYKLYTPIIRGLLRGKDIKPKSNVEDEERFGTRRKPWNYPDLTTNFHHSQNRTCCSPADEIEAMWQGNDDEDSNSMHSVEVQTEKSALYLWKQDRKNDNSLKKSSQEMLDNKKIHSMDNANSKNQAQESDHLKLKKTRLNYEHDKIKAKLKSNISSPEAFDEYAETDLDQPMDYTLCYNEPNLDDDKKRNASYLHSKNDFLCVEETVEEEKVGVIKPKGAFSKELTKNKREMFSNTSRSFKEIFNFFKDRDKKRSTTESTKSSVENQKLPKAMETCEQKFLKCSQPVQPPLEQCEKESKLKNETPCSQQTPLMFSRCSSLGSLNGFEQHSVQDERSSVVSDFSRRTSGVVSPSELPDSPAQTAAPGTKLQLKPQIGCFGKKKMPSPHQDKSKNASLASDNALQNENILRMIPFAKRSVFEDNLTSFKDESTPTKLHSMAASSLSSLTIDDEDEYDIVNKIILNKEKSNVIDETKIESVRENPLGRADLDDTSVKPEKTENSVNDDDDEEENFDDEKDDELTDLTPYEEQLLDECIRRGIAKWTKQNINEIKPFSWDVGLTCLATRAILNSRIRVNSYSDIDDTDNLTNHDIIETLTNNNLNFEKNSQNKEKESDNYEKCSNRDTSPTEQEMDLEEASDKFDENSYYITYEEHLLDQCIRRGMAKITKRNVNDIKPFSWDANQICLTTRAMILRERLDEEMYSCH